MKFISKAQDPWHTCAGEDGPQPHPAAADHKLLTLEQWHAVRDTWPAELATGVILPNDADVETLAEDLPRLQLVVLQFPKWVDGRAYSQARLLRGRYRFRGELRATGEVLVDMLPLLQRCGVDAAQLRHDQSLDAAQRALAFFPAHYQGDVLQPRPLFARDAA
ncbi:DUF934 domain-containing protein [Pelomonas sp. CA6]|uniref:DUF934 domain-containing protein n=1 Tax=Pelomonas sp. CA6 TaxID=2907999 RepID=UPI001F4BDD75|nr:DUF934 domain-containing protein [Pelomonas sp. CA6]MCH7343836.1 DUF934 domain-containing protein [Pelomonas sp. CA6]